MQKIDISSATLEEVCAFVETLGEKPFRGQQIFEWIHKKQAQSFDEMSNISQSLRVKLAENTAFCPPMVIKQQISHKDSTKKLLFALKNCDIMEASSESVNIEAVLMSYKHGLSACLSTQAGCRMGCDFCASQGIGLERNLTAGEIAGQYYQLVRMADERISNIVLMGVGEPLDNYDNVLRFIHLINHAKGANIGQRSITLSTCGLVPEIYALMKENLQINLAISLHAPNNQIRRKLMPIARKYDIDELLEACRAYAKGGRRITFEYIMIDGVNDSIGNAQELCKRIKGINCHINLIYANNIPEKGYTKSSPAKMRTFQEALTKAGFAATVRREMGADIRAACGQLRKDNQIKDNQI